MLINLLSVLSIILAIVIKVLELFEVVIKTTVEVLKRPPVHSKGHATLVSGASTPSFSALSVQDKTPECLCEFSKEEPPSFKSAVVEENSLVFEQADVFVHVMLSSDDIVISEVMSRHNAKQNKVPDNNETLGAAVTAVSAKVWRQYLCHADPELGVPDSEKVTTVNSSRLTAVRKTSMEFVIDSRIFTFEVCVIKDLSFDVILGRDFLRRFCFKVDFQNGLVSLPAEPSPFPFEGLCVDDDSDLIDKAFISSVNASHTFVIPPQSEILISGQLEDPSDNKYLAVLAFSDAELAKTSLVQHVIDTSDATPVKQIPYRTSPEDASSTGIGFTSAQVQNGKEVAIAYNGRGLNSAELYCSTTEREALALIEGIKKFQPHLQNRKFTVATDHSSLRWLMNVKDASGCLARWALLLQQYDFEIIHSPGPYRIVEQSSPVHFRLLTDTNKKVTFAVHANRMKPFIDPSLRPIEPPLVDDHSEPYLDESDIPDDNSESELPVDRKANSRPPVSDTTDSSSHSDNQVQPCWIAQRKTTIEFYQAKRIFKSRRKKGKMEYLVKWHNFP
ncbi:Retrovirus-related Pol polyprotein [Stylophora pistillata]|uniref:Retrovirus-related Pol polyprotein n=1 Tax=Stylophora pistillata TaxID=50429 RepID=A0A2B4RCR8_STYPI|nr:Retrovirus-related Pol polyprotein [Stylophora pistillata]